MAFSPLAIFIAIPLRFSPPLIREDHGFEILEGLGDGYISNFFFLFVPAAGFWPRPSLSSRAEGERDVSSFRSPITCRRRKLVEPDLVRVPATMPITSRVLT